VDPINAAKAGPKASVRYASEVLTGNEKEATRV
jgi:hypothetical protein